MRASLVVLLGLCLTATSVALFLFEPRPLTGLALSGYDALIRHVSVPQKSDRVVIVDIDETSLDVYGQWPWPRYRIADLTQSLLDAGAAVVVYDVLFAESDRTSPKQYLGDLNARFATSVELHGLPEEVRDFDGLFAKALEGEPVIVGCHMVVSDDNGMAVARVDRHYKATAFGNRLKGGQATKLEEHLTSSAGIMLPIPALRAAAANTAFINADPDFDNVVRRTPLLFGHADRHVYASLALEALRLYKGASQMIIDYNENGVKQIRVKDLKIPTDRAGRAIINYRHFLPGKRGQCFPRLAASDVLGGSFEPARVKNRIVFVGASAIGLRDNRATPISQEFPGVEIHATVVDNALTGDLLHNPAYMWGATVFLLAVIGIFLTTLISRGRATVSALLTLLVLIACVYASIHLFQVYRLVFIPSSVLTSTAGIYAMLTTFRFGQEEARRRKLRGMFGSMVSDEVLRYMEENPESYSLEGRDVEASIFFSDIAGFTPIAESMSAGDLSDLLNEYLSAMNGVILNRRGFVDKYEGDAIMAVWGAPFAMEDHAAEACLAALEQAEEMGRLRPILKERFGHEVYVRMGIHSGAVKAGNYGSAERMQYTVIGDAVNLASRLEPANKIYGTEIMVSEETYRQASGVVAARLVDRILLKGKSRSTAVYELWCAKGELTGRDEEFIHFYEAALNCHWDRAWDDALEMLDRAQAIHPGDGPCRVLRERIDEFRGDPPDGSWSGEFSTVGIKPQG